MTKKIFIGAALFIVGLGASGCASPFGRPSFNEVQRQHEQSACAELGLDPGREAFGQCVADLDASLFFESTAAAH